MFVQKQRACQVVEMARRRTKERRDVETPPDGRQWRNIVREVPNFAGGARNLWFGLNIDDMNPFKMKKMK
jgi:hypothetical protein